MNVTCPECEHEFEVEDDPPPRKIAHSCDGCGEELNGYAYERHYIGPDKHVDLCVRCNDGEKRWAHRNDIPLARILERFWKKPKEFKTISRDRVKAAVQIAFDNLLKVCDEHEYIFAVFDAIESQIGIKPNGIEDWSR